VRALDGARASLYARDVRALAVVVATVGPIGRVPVAPGTAGSLAALALLPALAALRARSGAAYLLALALLAAVAVWAAGRAEDALGGHDHAAIVIDEVVGMVLAATFVPPTWSAWALAFLLFRLFDVVKPFPAGHVDRRVPGGLGTVGDDVIAGLYAGLATRLALGVL
jgi:phosphatidylglycerophosphatase A